MYGLCLSQAGPVAYIVYGFQLHESLAPVSFFKYGSWRLVQEH